jgi:protein tyrosine phosphatase
MIKKTRCFTDYCALKIKKGTVLEQSQTMRIDPAQVFSEKTLAHQMGKRYVRFYIPEHMTPSPHQVNAFIQLKKKLPQGAILYIHCRGGLGRTTTFLAMLDMMLNAKSDSFEKILKRQHKLHGENLLAIPKNGYKRSLKKKRLEFLQKFYAYAQHNQDNFTTPYQDSETVNPG